ncbi:unnamed protein product [Caenorhabditis bovis]|uniref:Uncharacterized protein n=1 Tax=Caenorhabditis bovis TaxID=2654633 RepID=A0A8S1EWH9_9PELO|nr:unnamed protein product [Caenorhabditis bovis]
MSESGICAKRMRIDDCISNVKKLKENEGMNPDNETTLLNFINFGSSDSKGGFTTEDRELRKDRGDRLLQLFREQPSLSSSASARRFEKNHERAMIWEEITRKINDEFGEKLEVLSVDKVKKLLTYYKKKEEGNFDNIKGVSIPSLTPMEDLKVDEEPEKVEENGREHFSDLLTMLSQNILTNDSTHKFEVATKSETPFTSSTPSPSTTPFSAGERIYFLKKERHDFVVKRAEYYIQRMCFDNSSRSATVNAERHNMWIKITNETNEKYASILGGLGVEQAKKLYSNCKRRRRMKNEAESNMANTSGSGESNQSTSRTSLEPDEHEAVENERQKNTIDSDNSATMEILSNIEEIVRNIEKDNEIKMLKEQLKERDAQISKLQKLINQQSTHYKKQMTTLLDELKTRVLNANF